MVETSLSIMLKSGLHARPANEFVKLASSFGSEIIVTKGDRKVNAKSILGLLSLGIAHGDLITLNVSGADEQAGMAALQQLLSQEEV